MLIETKLKNFGISKITQKAIDEKGVKTPTLISATYSNDNLDLLFEVESSSEKHYKVNLQGKSTGSSAGYAVILRFPNIEKKYKKITRENLKDIFNDNDVLVHCDCPAFYWQGMQQDDFINGNSRYSFQGKGGSHTWTLLHSKAGGTTGAALCKHLESVKEWLFDNVGVIADKLNLDETNFIKTKAVVRKHKLHKVQKLTETITVEGHLKILTSEIANDVRDELIKFFDGNIDKVVYGKQGKERVIQITNNEARRNLTFRENYRLLDDKEFNIQFLELSSLATLKFPSIAELEEKSTSGHVTLKIKDSEQPQLNGTYHCRLGDKAYNTLLDEILCNEFNNGGDLLKDKVNLLQNFTRNTLGMVQPQAYTRSEILADENRKGILKIDDIKDAVNKKYGFILKDKNSYNPTDLVIIDKANPDNVMLVSYKKTKTNSLCLIDSNFIENLKEKLNPDSCREFEFEKDPNIREKYLKNTVIDVDKDFKPAYSPDRYYEIRFASEHLSGAVATLRFIVRQKGQDKFTIETYLDQESMPFNKIKNRLSKEKGYEGIFNQDKNEDPITGYYNVVDSLKNIIKNNKVEFLKKLVNCMFTSFDGVEYRPYYLLSSLKRKLVTKKLVEALKKRLSL